MRQRLQCSGLEDILRLSRMDLAQAVVSCNPRRVHQQRLCRIANNHFLGGTVLREHQAIAPRWDAPHTCCHLFPQRLHVSSKDLLRFLTDTPGDDGDHPADFALNERSRVRDHFTQAEMDAILALNTLSLRDALMLRIMSETGLRRRAVSWLLVDCVFDRAAQHCLPSGRALEKGLVTRPFCLSLASQKLVEAYLENEHPGPHVRWLFPSCKKGNQSPIDPSVVNTVLLKACRATGVRLQTRPRRRQTFAVVTRTRMPFGSSSSVALWNTTTASRSRAQQRVVLRTGCGQMAGTSHRRCHLRYVLGRAGPDSGHHCTVVLRP